MAVRSDDERLSVALARQANERLGDGDLVGDREALCLKAGLPGKRLALLGGSLRPLAHRGVDLDRAADVNRDGREPDGGSRELHSLERRARLPYDDHERPAWSEQRRPLTQSALGGLGAVVTDQNGSGTQFIAASRP